MNLQVTIMAKGDQIPGEIEKRPETRAPLEGDNVVDLKACAGHIITGVITGSPAILTEISGPLEGCRYCIIPMK